MSNGMSFNPPQGPVSRRSFLKYGAVVVAGVAASRILGPSVARALLADANDEYGGLIMGIQSYTLRDRSFDKMLDAMQHDLKLHAVELFPQHLTGLSPTQAKEKLAAHDVKAMSYGVVGFSKDEKANRAHFELAKTFGMTNLSCDPDPDSFDSLDKLTEEYKVTVAIHPHGPDNRWAKIDTIHNAIKDHSKMIGLCADTGHLIRADQDPLKALETFKDRTYALHLKDFKKTAKGDWEDVPAGDASLDVDGVVKFLLTNKSTAPVFIEYEGGNPVPSSQKSLERVKQAVKKAKTA